jgi:hypothetical protein
VSRIDDFFRRATDRFDQGINSDEFVVFYPSVAKRPPVGGDWRVEIRGRIYEQRQLLSELPMIALALAGVPNATALDELIRRLGNDVDCLRIFNDRIKDFVLDGQSNEELDFEIAGTHLKSHLSIPQGFFGLGESWQTVSPTRLGDTGDSAWIRYTASGEGGRAFQGRSQWLDRHGVIVVSDIDDTIKDSNVPEPLELTFNTLFRPFRSTPRMAEIYKDWQKKQAQFIYLSNSPYQLFRPLIEYLQGAAGYPDGSYYLRCVDALDLRQEISNLVASDDKVSTQENAKKHNLIPILETFPESSFILVGDSTEFDAEIYADLYLGTNFPAKFSSLRKAYSDRIKRIFIRDVMNSRRRKRAEEALARIGKQDVARFFDAQTPDIQEKADPVFQESQRRRGGTA